MVAMVVCMSMLEILFRWIYNDLIALVLYKGLVKISFCVLWNKEDVKKPPKNLSVFIPQLRSAVMRLAWLLR